MTTTIKMKIHPATQEVTSDYVLDCIFQISEKSTTSNFGTIAKELLKLVAKKGDEGLHAEDWKQIIQSNKLEQHQYFSIIKTLKNAGIIRKTKGRYYLINDFKNHLGKMSSAMSQFYMDMGKSI